ncbi:recombinase family protein [Aquirufa antheringensis]|uniref:recombinase family protein n=1 Tax=Aquirufa antheringensis TaxID=2516559 RepID=UPI0022A8A5B1|nr:recombinase family protein [Aquirufa antheringensis]MCZ2488342.1 recombinase family protein [Aquirufa antheringensis]
MKILYTRVSTQEQNPSRQLQDVNSFDYVLVDKCSGLIDLFDRPKGSQIKKLIDQGKLTHLEIHSIDRIHRTTIGAIQLWKYFTDLNITLVCRNPNIRNFDANGNPDKFSETLMSLLAVMSGFEKSLIKERQMEGIRLRQAKGLYMGRKINSKETPEKFLEKEKSQKILSYLKKGTYTAKEVASILDISTTTITKTRKVAKEFGML